MLTGKSPDPQKSVVAGSNVSGVVVYTVPYGRTFVGTIIVSTSGQGSVTSPTGVTVTLTAGTYPVNLTGGNVVKCQANSPYTYAFGIEQ